MPPAAFLEKITELLAAPYNESTCGPHAACMLLSCLFNFFSVYHALDRAIRETKGDYNLNVHEQEQSPDEMDEARELPYFKVLDAMLNSLHKEPKEYVSLF